MKYRKDKYGNEISVLGYGCMRFTSFAGKIDIDKAEMEIMEAYNAGVNYYDTAYIYPGSEAALGEILSRNGIREKVNIATKLPHYLVKKTEDFEKIFSEELKRLKTDYVDYYLIHMMNDIKAWERVKALGLCEWLEEKKKAGQVKQIGFSYHGNSDMFLQILDCYGWDFCQIQYNYLDVNSQAGITGLKKANEKGLPVVIMEPLRGGKLVNNLPKNAEKAFAENKEARKPAEWAFRWLWNQPEIMCVLSGMNSIEMVDENLKAADDAFVGCLKDEDLKMYDTVVKAISETMLVPCTGCRYCMPCPKGVDIPGAFAAYNKIKVDGKFAATYEYFKCVAVRKDYTGAANCVGCGKCEQHCPQGIKIRDELKNVKKNLEGPLFKAGKKLAPLVIKY